MFDKTSYHAFGISSVRPLIYMHARYHLIPQPPVVVIYRDLEQMLSRAPVIYIRVVECLEEQLFVKRSKFPRNKVIFYLSLLSDSNLQRNVGQYRMVMRVKRKPFTIV